MTFRTTAEVEPIVGVVGQETAMQALRFGLETRAMGQNIFVRGLTGTGRMTLLRQLLNELHPTCPEARDRCYVHNFAQPDRPRLISLPRGQGRIFRRHVDALADFIRDQLRQALSAESVAARRTAIDEAAKEQVKTIIEPFERDLQAAGLAMVSIPVGPVVHSMLFPLVNGKPMPPEEFQSLHGQGQIDDAQFARYREQRELFESRLEQVKQQILGIRQKHVEEVREFIEGQTRVVLADFVQRILKDLSDEGVKQFLTELIDDVVENRMHAMEEGEDFTRIYRVNVLHERCEDEECPIIVENAPTMMNLLGGVDREMGPMGMMHSDHTMIRGGSLLQADGGYLILEARDVLTEVGAWKSLVRTLRTGRLDIVPPELSLPWLGQMLKPEPIDIQVKVILIGDAEIFQLLDGLDPDFPNLFKVLADFDSQIVRDDRGIAQYAGVLARLARDEGLLNFDAGAVAALIEHGARIVARRKKLTARFGRLADLAREGSFLAQGAKRDVVTGDDVRQAIARTRSRADLPSRRFRELLTDGTIRVETDGRQIGQINGLAVLQSGPLTFGFPARITATIGPGSAGVINIEREAALSGAIHTKGFYILGGLLRHLLQADHPLAFDASVAFEQSYGGIDGDSASGAEICCLLSALTAMPVRQDLAMTGAIDQMGNILPVGAVNEKIEGFFDVCQEIGLTGGQGVIIPASNVGDLMLRHDVVGSCAEGRFAVYPVSTVHEALELLTGWSAGRRAESEPYPEDTLLGLAVRRARSFWQRAAAPNTSRA